MSVDPLADDPANVMWSPYTSMWSNPINVIDPDGMMSTYNWDNGRYEDEEGNEVSWNSVREEYGIGGSDWPPSSGSAGDVHQDSDGNFYHDGNAWINESGSYVLPEVTVMAFSAQNRSSAGVGIVASGVRDYLVQGSMYRSPSGKFYSYQGRRGWNQYTGTKANMNSVLDAARLASRVNHGVGALNYVSIGSKLYGNELTGTQAAIEIMSNSISTFAPSLYSIPWTFGYEILGRQGIARTKAYQRLKYGRGGKDGLISTKY